jgi:(1->4)-alpha-D-glucan 1-alpha-D-glucosylmutase
MTAALDRLCSLCGIATEYADIWGNRHLVPTRTKRALLGAMGIPAADEAQVRHALEACEARAWRRILPAVLVAREGDLPVQVPVTLPAALAQAPFRWTFVAENGERREGDFVPAGLTVLGEGEADGAAHVRYALPLPVRPPAGYHRLELCGAEGAEPGAGMSLVVAPERCYQPEAVTEDGRVWGVSLQLYALRSERNWGMGDFGDLDTALELAAAHGADAVGVNPLHALFPCDPGHASPYSPSSRLFLNVLYLDIQAVADYRESDAARQAVQEPEFQARLRALRAAELVEYEKVAAAKIEVLELLYGHFRSRHLDAGSQRGHAFRAFQARGGKALRRHALFEALHEHFRAQDPSLWGWPTWPEPYRDPASAQVAAFEAGRQERVEFYEYLQWQAALQLEAAGGRSMALRLGVGLYEDLALGPDRGGAEVWADQALYALKASVGAPPDDFSLHGQDWGLPPFIPERLADAAYGPFIATLRANMRHAGALRIDHVMGLMRLFWIPRGDTPENGAYVSYPLDDLLGILALESQRNRCLVIGEDLGTVPDAVREKLKPMGVLSYRLLYFEREPDGTFRTPANYPDQALVAVGTHDLPTLAGYWLGLDLDARARLGLFPSEELRQRQVIERAQDRARLLVALEREGLLPPGASVHPVAVPEMTPELARAVHLYLARTPARLMMVQPEDFAGQLEQVNLPGTAAGHPNWRRRLPLALEQWPDDPRVRALAEGLCRERGGGVQALPAPVPEASPEATRPLIPRATYRLQLNRDLSFERAAGLVDYLRELGVSHCYASPFLRARPGSAHGYDIIDHAALNPEIGSPEAFDGFVDALHRQGMGLIMDMVPNHMGVMGSDNAWWLDVLENGQASPRAGYFDIEWQPIHGPGGKILLPVLGDSYGTVLEQGELRLSFDAQSGEFSVLYFQHRFPVDPGTYALILAWRLEVLEARLGAEDPILTAFQSLVTAFGHLPGRDDLTSEQLAERNRDKEVHKRRLAELCAGSPDIAWFVGENVRLFNGDPGDPGSFDRLHKLLEEQAYRLASWRVASDEINYRRFFDINDLAGIRVEEVGVFKDVHRLACDLLAAGKVDGLRIDHPDGLYNPAEYFRRLQHYYALHVLGGAAEVDFTEPAPADQAKPLYVVAEKILVGDERLPKTWPVHGTTGYDFANLVNGLFVDGSAAAKMDRLYGIFLGESLDFGELLYWCKRLIIKVAMASELSVLAHQLGRIALADRHTRDYTINNLRVALTEVVACFPVYRTYISRDGVSAEDRRVVELAVRAAKKRSLAADISIFDFVREALLVRLPQRTGQVGPETATSFAMKFQQYTAPVMAKGMEDTTFYRYNRLVSLNDVGSDPRQFGVSVAAFHRANQERARRWPHAMINTGTHDSKRSEDVRARINVLSELPAEWRLYLTRWSRYNRGSKRKVDGVPCPCRNDEYLLYQTLVGAWPLEDLDEAGLAAFRRRIEDYMIKAVREAKEHSSWINPDAAYEDALTGFIRALLEDPRFLDEFLPFQRRVARFGMFNSLSQALLKLAAPGVPDIYQGNELWNFSLVDPDNRRPVDFDRRQALLAEVKALEAGGSPARALLESMADGRIKLYLIWKALSLRRTREGLFRDGDYLPLRVEGARAENLCAFARRKSEEWVVCVAPRWFTALAPGPDDLPVGASAWADTRVEVPVLPAEAKWANAFTGELTAAQETAGGPTLAVAELFGNFPWALLVPEVSVAPPRP